MREYHNLDCMDLERGLPSFPDKYFDLAIVDPPYGIGASNESFISAGSQRGKSKTKRGGNYKSGSWDSQSPTSAFFEELIRVSRYSIIWGANHFIDKIPNADSSCWIVWDKLNGDNGYADCELAWTNFGSAVRKFSYRWQGMIQGNMKNKQQRIHPTEKPFELYRWLLKNYAKEGMKLLDTHVGSASSLIAFEEFGFDYVAYEKDPDYYRDSMARLTKWRSEPRLFTGQEVFEASKQQSLF